MSIFIDTQPTRVDFYSRALAQNVTLFTSNELIVYAADWRYQLVQKLIRIERLPGGAVRSAQLSDIIFLIKAIELDGKEEIKRHVVRNWYRYVKDNTFNEINDTYHAIFGSSVFV
jgi:hypothetical protein